MASVFLYDAPITPIDRREILRYAGVRGEVPEIDALLDECLLEIKDHLLSRVCYCEFPLKNDGASIQFGEIAVRSKQLSAHLKDCSHAILFAATVGIQLDRLILKYTRISPAKALMLQAIGTERIEALCDSFCHDLAKDHTITKRYSPGYGDLPLEFQKELFSVLQCQKHLGLTLNESLLMSPTKSVTAIIGIK